MMEFDRFFKICCNYFLSAIKDKIIGVQDKAYAFYWVCTPITHHCSTSICTHYLLASSITSISPLLLDFITKGTSSPTHSPTLPHSVSLSVSLALSLTLYLSFIFIVCHFCLLLLILRSIKGLYYNPLGVCSFCPCPTTNHPSSCPCPCPLSGSDVTSRTISSETKSSSSKIKVIDIYPFQ